MLGYLVFIQLKAVDHTCYWISCSLFFLNQLSRKKNFQVSKHTLYYVSYRLPHHTHTHTHTHTHMIPTSLSMGVFVSVTLSIYIYLSPGMDLLCGNLNKHSSTSIINSNSVQSIALATALLTTRIAFST